jgi:Holliday junction resolvasome RuvABC endonuclease subunit
MSRIRVVGLDPSLRNWGVAYALLNIDTLAIDVTAFRLVETKPNTKKQVRQNSADLECAQQLAVGQRLACVGASVAFCEVPVGSQSARAMASYGICVGVLGSCPIPLIQVTPTEVKLAAVGHREAAKEEMIEWGVNNYPDAPWIRDRNGKVLGKNEHLADAIAAIVAGIQTPEFRAVLGMLRAARPEPVEA